jgi:hypothetical protein
VTACARCRGHPSGWNARARAGRRRRGRQTRARASELADTRRQGREGRAGAQAARPEQPDMGRAIPPVRDRPCRRR